MVGDGHFGQAVATLQDLGRDLGFDVEAVRPEADILEYADFE